MWKQTTVIGDQMQPGRTPRQRATAAQIQGTDQQKQNDSHHLNQGKPELHLGKPLHADHIHGRDQRQRHQGKKPLRHPGKGAPIVHIQRYRGDIDDAGHRPVEKIHPSGHVGRLLPKNSRA